MRPNKITAEINRLKSEGYRVYIQHERYAEPHYIDGNENRLFIQAHTLCWLYKDNELKGYGFSYCSVNDQFVRRIGTAMALGRAIKSLSTGTLTPAPADFIPIR